MAGGKDGETDVAQVPRQQQRLHVCFMSGNAVRILLGLSDGFGGAEVELINVATQLATERDVDVSLVTVSAAIPDPVSISGINVVPVRPTSNAIFTAGLLRRRLMVLGYYWRFMRALARPRPDLYYSKLGSDLSILTFIVSRLRRKPFVFRFEHDWETNPTDLRTHIFRGGAVQARLFVACLRRAELIVCQTEKQKQAIASHYGIKPVIVPNAHRIPPLVESGAARRREILWVARTHPMKRPLLFLELARRIPDLQFTIVMAPDHKHAALSAEVEAQTATLPNVTYIPGLPQSELPAVYQRARLFVLTSDAEGFANTVIEALKWGVPVLSLLLNFDNLLRPVVSSTEVRLTENEVFESAPGFCAEGDFERLVEQLERLRDNDQFWAACSRSAHQYASEHFDVKTIAAVYVQMFRKLINRAAPGV